MFVRCFRSLNVVRTIPQNTSVQSTALEKVYKYKWRASIAVEEAYGRDLMGEEEDVSEREENYCSCQHEKLFIVHNYQNKNN